MKAKMYLMLALTLSMITGVYLAGQSTSTPRTNTQYVLPYESVPQYWYGPHLQKISITTYADTGAEFLALQGGAINVMEYPLEPSQIATSQATHGFQTNLSNDLSFFNIPLNAGRFPSNHLAYRQAMASLIDYNDIVTHDLLGYGGQMPDQMTPAFPSVYHSNNHPVFSLATANTTLYAGGFFFNKTVSAGVGAWFWTTPTCVKSHALETGCAQISVGGTIFLARSDDPVRKYIGDQLISMQATTKNVYHFDRLFSVIEQTKVLAFTVTYAAPDCAGKANRGTSLAYNSTNCAGTGVPAFTAYTQGASPSTSDPLAFFWCSYTANALCADVPYNNFGHYINSTINTEDDTMFFSSAIDANVVKSLNHDITFQEWAIPVMYVQDWNGISDRITGHLGALNSNQCCGSYYENNPFSFWRAHLKGRSFGGSINLGSYSPLNQLSQFNPDSNWVFDAQLFNRIYDPLMWLDPSTNQFIPILASAVTITTGTNGRLYNFTGDGTNNGWLPSGAAPYMVKNPAFANNPTYYINQPTYEKVAFTLYSNATWHDGSAITPNDILWNIIVTANDPNNFLQPTFPNLMDVNATGNVITLWYTQTSPDYPLFAALENYVPPLPWIHHDAHWTGNVSYVSLATVGSLNLTAGAKNMLDGSGPYKYDTASVGSPFVTGDTFDILANPNWIHADSNRAGYSTGIAVISPYLPATVSGSIPLAVAITNGANAKGLTFDSTHHDFVPDPSTQSDTTTATVVASIAESPSTTATLTYDSGSKLYKGTLTAPTTAGTYHITITASNTGSIATTYGPGGSSQASQTGVSWEGDADHTAFTVLGGGGLPVSPMQILLLSITSVVAATLAVKVRVKRVRL